MKDRFLDGLSAKFDEKLQSLEIEDQDLLGNDSSSAKLSGFLKFLFYRYELFQDNIHIEDINLKLDIRNSLLNCIEYNAKLLEPKKLRHAYKEIMGVSKSKARDTKYFEICRVMLENYKTFEKDSELIDDLRGVRPDNGFFDFNDYFLYLSYSIHKSKLHYHLISDFEENINRYFFIEKSWTTDSKKIDFVKRAIFWNALYALRETGRNSTEINEIINCLFTERADIQSTRKYINRLDKNKNLDRPWLFLDYQIYFVLGEGVLLDKFCTVPSLINETILRHQLKEF